MKCRNCGTALPEDAIFCEVCGTRQTQPFNKTKQKGGRKKIKKSFFAVVLTIVLAVVVGVIIFAVKKTSQISEHDILALLDREHECIVVMYDMETFEIPLENAEEYTYISVTNVNASSAVVYAWGYDEENGSFGCAYLADGVNSYQKLSDTTYYNCVLAAKNSAVALIDDEYTLILYNDGKRTKIADDVSNVKLSPDGKTLVYTTRAEEDEDSDVVLYIEGTSRRIAENMTVYSVSDKGKYIYAVDTEKQGLYVFNEKGESEKIQNDVTVKAVNADSTEILFSSGEKLYVSVKGGEKQKLFSLEQPYGYKMVGTYKSNHLSASYITYYDMKNFNHFYLNTGNSILYYVDEKYETTKIASSVDSAYTTENEKTVYYEKNGSIYAYSLSTQEAEKVIKDMGEETDFIVSADGKEIYYINEDGELCCYDGEEIVVVEEDGDEVEGMGITRDGTLIYLFDMTSYENTSYSVGDLYYWQKGGRAKQLASDVCGIMVCNNRFLYATYDGDTLEYFISNSGVDDFKLIFSQETEVDSE